VPRRPSFAPPTLVALSALLTLIVACSTAPLEPDDANGQWGSNQAGLTISRSGGNLTMQCGTAVIDSGWSLSSSGAFRGTGATFSGGGPDPIGGRPRQPSSFSGQISGSTFTLTILVLATSASIGPLRMERDGPMISQVCL
jgi:hypothetical protein